MPAFWAGEPTAWVSEFKAGGRTFLPRVRSCLAFWFRLRGQPMKVLPDNRTTVAYVAHQGGTRSLPLLRIACQIFLWAEHYVSSLTAAYLPGSEHLSRPAELEVHGPQRGGSQLQVFTQDLENMGNTSHRSDGFEGEFPASSLLLPILGSTSPGPCPSHGILT